MIIRGAAGRNIPYGKVDSSDVVYFINNNGEGLVKVTAIANSIFCSDKMDKEQSIELQVYPPLIEVADLCYMRKQ